MNTRTNITLKKGFHRNQSIVRIEFPYDQKVIDLLRKETTSKWSRTLGCWYMPEKDFNLGRFFNVFKPLAYIDYSRLKNQSTLLPATPQRKKYNANLLKKRIPVETQNKIEAFKAWLEQGRYGENTIKTYIHQLGIFFGYYSDRYPEDITTQEITAFNSEFILKNNLSATFQNQTISALKKFYTWNSSRKIEIESIERPRKSRPLPKVIPIDIGFTEKLNPIL